MYLFLIHHLLCSLQISLKVAPTVALSPLSAIWLSSTVNVIAVRLKQSHFNQGSSTLTVIKIFGKCNPIRIQDLPLFILGISVHAAVQHMVRFEEGGGAVILHLWPARCP